MKPHVYRGVLASGFARFSAWLDSRKSWEQDLFVGALLLVIAALFSNACRLAGVSWTP